MKVLGPILTFLFAWIDSIVAKMITLVYNLLMNLSNLVLYSDSIVKTLGQRIGIILGIFMLFRLAVSLINYMISPEKFSDNKTGGAQLVKNIIISLVLLATINTIFETAYMVQKRIVESGIVQKIFFGDNSETDSVDIGYYLYTGLFTPNEDVIPECKTMWDITEPISQECDDKLFELTETNARNSIYEARNDLDMSKVFSNYDVVTANRDGAFTGTELFNYTPIVSTAVGVIALLILVSFSMELAIRAVKLLFLQIVAPVPIIANMDTGKGKDIFNKWLKQCINTYISVFIRLIAINFGVFMIVLVKGNFKDIFTGNILLNIFVIIGCLMFAKQVPKLIEDMFGIKLDGMTLHPLKNFKDNALFSNQIFGAARGVAAGAVGIGAGAFGAAIASGKLGNKWWETAGATIRGAGRGMIGGVGAGYKSKNGLEAIRAGRGRWGAEADYVNSLDGTTLGGRMKAGLQQRLHIATDADKIKKDIDNLNSFAQTADSALKRAEAESVKYNDLSITDANGHALTMAQHKQEQERLTRMRNENMSFEEFAKKEGVNTKVKDYNEFAEQFKKGMGRDATSEDYQAYQNQMKQMIDDARRRHEDYKIQRDTELQELSDKINKDTKTFATEYISQASDPNSSINDGEIDNYINQIQYYQDELSKRGYNYSITDADGHINGKAIKDSKQSATEQRQAIESNRNEQGVNIYQQQQANAAATKPKGGK